MKKILIIILSLFFLSCGDDDAPLWVNTYDPNLDKEELAKICEEAQCGNKQYNGSFILCGVCDDGKYCSTDKKCVSSCETFNCGTMWVDTYSGKKNVDCGSCRESERCSTQNICLSDESICGTKKCGKVSFMNDENQTVDVACGTCNEDEYCSEDQKCTLVSSECIGKCGSFLVDGYDGKVEVDCDGCEGEIAYCGTDNECRTACEGKECGTDIVKLQGDENKTFTCGSCGEGMNYCSNIYKCEVACELKECGEEIVNKFGDGETPVACGTCESPDYCSSALTCSEGTVSGDYIYDSSIVVEPKLGLMWHKASVADKTQAQAVAYCSASSVAGFSDWTLPDITQLRSIVRGCDKTETCGITSSCTDSTCSDDNCQGCINSGGAGPEGLYLVADIWDYSGDANGRFWSSSEVPDKADSYWFIRFSNASVAYNWDGSEYNVICVRNAD